MKLKQARILIRKIVKMEYDDPFIAEAASGAEYNLYKKMSREQRVDYDKQLKQNFDILSKQKYSSSITSSEINI